MVPSAVVSTAVMTVAAIAGILILVNGSITISTVLAYAVHITEIVAGAVAIFIAGSVGRRLFGHSFRCYGCRSCSCICQSLTVCRIVCCRTIAGHG